MLLSFDEPDLPEAAAKVIQAPPEGPKYAPRGMRTAERQRLGLEKAPKAPPRPLPPVPEGQFAPIPDAPPPHIAPKNPPPPSNGSKTVRRDMDYTDRDKFQKSAIVQALTFQERKVLDCICNNRDGRPTVRYIASYTGLTEKEVERTLNSRVMWREYKEILYRTFGAAIGAVMDVAIQSAMIPGREGFSDRQMLLRMAGVYSPKGTTIDISGGEAETVDTSGKVVNAVADRLAEAIVKRKEFSKLAEGDQRSKIIDAAPMDDASRGGDGPVIPQAGFLEDEDAPDGEEYPPQPLFKNRKPPAKPAEGDLDAAFEEFEA